MKKSSENPRLLELISDLQEESLSEADRESLNALLKEDPENRKIYREYMDLHARLHFDYTGGAMPSAMPTPTQARRKTASLSTWWMGLAAALVIALLVNALVFGLRGGSSQAGGDRETENPVDGIAVLTRAVAVQWDAMYRPVREGDALPRGRLKIRSGLAQIEFFSGATVILEGPAELELLTPQRARLHHGKVRAFVPEPAHGFTIEGPDFDTVDLGTEFAISVDSAGRGEVHVVDGEVSLHEKGGNLIRNLTGGSGIRTTPGISGFEAIQSSEIGFVGREKMAEMAEENWRGKAELWERQRWDWIGDPDTLVYFDFEDHKTWDRRLRNGKSGGPEGAIVGALWTQGRWPGKGALEFKRINDRVRLQVPGEFDSITFAARVRIEGLDRWLSSLMLTDGWDEGEPHWQISDKGGLVFGLRDIGTDRSEPVIGPGDLGRWLHIAAVFDRKEHRIFQYLDGKLVSSIAAKGDSPVRIGGAEIGNWRPEHIDSGYIRSLNGRVDEFLLVKRALTAAEIHKLYLAGNPAP